MAGRWPLYIDKSPMYAKEFCHPIATRLSRLPPCMPMCTRERESRQDSGHRDPFMVRWFTVQCYSYLVGYRHCDTVP